MVAEGSPRIVLVDDLRWFVDGRGAQVARTSAAGVALLQRHRTGRVDQLWLDHDHSVGAGKISQVLQRWGYRVRVVSGSPYLGYSTG